jgi:hypothetical protein
VRAQKFFVPAARFSAGTCRRCLAGVPGRRWCVHDIVTKDSCNFHQNFIVEKYRGVDLLIKQLL